MQARKISTSQLYSNRPGASISGTRRIVTFVIVEEMQTKWHYHWSSMADQTKSLCGRDTMPANIDPNLWGGEHPVIKIQWCQECEESKERILPSISTLKPVE